MTTRLHKLTAVLLTIVMLMAFIPDFTLTTNADGTPTVTNIDFNRDSPAYDEGTNTFYVSDGAFFILTITGENLTKFNEMGGLEALFQGDAGWAITSVSIQSDTQAVATVDPFALTYILSNTFSSEATAVMIENDGTQYGSTKYVKIKHAPTYRIDIMDSENGSVEHNFYSSYVAVGSTVKLKVYPDYAYKLKSLTVDGVDVTGQVSGDEYSFTMPDKAIEVEALFEAVPTVEAKVSAVDAENGNNIQGALLQLLDESGLVVEEWASSEDYYEVRYLTPNVEYTLQSTVAPDGYMISDKTKFKVDEEGKVISSGAVTAEGTILVIFEKTVVNISAVNKDDGTALQGARIEISDSNDNAVEEWESDSGIKTIVGLKTGEAYTLRVITAPQGYETPTDNSFAIDENGEITYTSTSLTDGTLLVEFVPAQALWGASADSLIHSGTLSDAFDAAAQDSNIKYIQLQKDIESVNYNVDGGNFTLDLNGKDIKGDGYTIYIMDPGTKVTMIDSADVDGTVSTGKGVVAISAVNGAELVIDGGNYEGGTAVMMEVDTTSVTIKNGTFASEGVFTVDNCGGTLVIEGGNFIAGKDCAVATGNSNTVDCSTIIRGGSFGAGARGHFSYYGDVVDFSDYDSALGITVSNFSATQLSVSDTTIKLPAHHVMLDSEGIVQTTLGNYEIYTIGKASYYTVTFVDWDDAFLGSDIVEKGKGATAPTSPTREGWKFIGWDKTFDNVTGTLKVKAEYRELTNLEIILTESSFVYDGTPKGPDITVKDGSILLVAGTDYDYTYQDNTNAGNAKVVVTLKGSYAGTYEKAFTINKKQIDSELNLTAPVKNAIPETVITGEGYTADVVWSPVVTDKFGYDTEYSATVTITPDSNHTTDGITSYTVAGARSVTNVANVVTVTFDKTGSKASSGSVAVRYRVEFDTNGGSAILTKVISRNSTVSEPVAPKKDGYIFKGWYSDKELTTAYNFKNKVTRNITLYAKWEKESDTSGTHNCPSLAFDDLDIRQWYHLDTDYVLGRNIFKGSAKATFTPYGNITRAMMITVLYRAEGEPEVKGKSSFEDIDENAYYANAVVWGQQNGIIKGYSKTEYAPEEDILREQIAAIMYRYSKFKGYDVSVKEDAKVDSYKDYDSISEYARLPVQWAIEKGIIKGREDNTLAPTEFAQRVEIAAMLHRFLEENK